jgi:hypothetical protein
VWIDDLIQAESDQWPIGVDFPDRVNGVQYREPAHGLAPSLVGRKLIVHAHDLLSDMEVHGSARSVEMPNRIFAMRRKAETLPT